MRSLEQINNQIRQLQNEAQMLIAMARHLERLDIDILANLNRTLSELTGLAEEAQGLAFEISAVETAFAELYPERQGAETSSDTLAKHARERWEQVRHALDQSMRMQAQVVRSASVDQRLIDTLSAKAREPWACCTPGRRPTSRSRCRPAR